MIPPDLSCPFETPDGLESNDIQATAYEIFFTSCRSSPGFGGRNAIQFYSSDGENSVGVGSSRFKRAVGLKMLKRSLSSRRNNPKPASIRRPRRPLTSAEIMREQMMVSEASDNRLRKTLMRTLVGQTGRRAETIILPLELIRHLKPTEFNDSNEYHIWQRRQLKTLEVGLLLYPSNPLDKADNLALSLRDIIRSSTAKPIDIEKTSEAMRTICHCVVSLAWRSADGSSTDICHWADGYSFNATLYVSLLNSVFDLKDETCVLDEVDELLELMKKTWPTLGFNKPMHDLCFTWVFFQRYVLTGQVEENLLSASLAMLTEVANDSKKADKEPTYIKMLSSVLTCVTVWCEKRLMDYHGSFSERTIGAMEHILPLFFSATRILEEDVHVDKREVASESAGNRVDQYTRSSLQHAFSKMVENGINAISRKMSFQLVCETLVRLAQETEELALKEMRSFSMILKKWHPISAGVAAATLHSCYGAMLKQFLTCNSDITNEMLAVLQRADKLEKLLVKMVVEDSVECEDGGKAVFREMVLYDIDSIIVKFLGQSVNGRLKRIRVVLHRAEEAETWNPKSKTEPYSHSAVELVKQAREVVLSFFENPISVSEDLVHEFANGIEEILGDYNGFIASCGSKENYIPTLPPLTRCSRDSRLIKLWKKATPCAVTGFNPYNLGVGLGLGLGIMGLEEEGHNNSRPSTSRGTQRLYIRLNTLHYLLSQLTPLDKCLCHPSRIIHSHKNHHHPHFEHTRSAIMAATHHVSEVAAYRLIFIDSNSVLYGTLYEGHVVNARITPALKVLKQNLTLLCAIVTERAQPLAIKEVLKASFEAYLMVLIAGGNARSFSIADHEMIEEDLKLLKRVFASYGEGVALGLMSAEAVDKEAETVEVVVELMGRTTEQLLEDFTALYPCEGSDLPLPVPPTTGKWSCSDPDTILRVLCHRKDRVANLFLKTTFNLAKRT
ncbi:protein unc-13 homolog [Bidens hawaiensis]|uniref:protein unc-13 homolog n=1 Tax=Bidens hawaiensis TaxID=980011 RepID=UPI00404945CE